MIESFEARDPLQLLLGQLLQPAITLLIAVLIGLFVERVLLVILRKYALLTPWHIDDIIIDSLRGGVTTFWVTLLGVYLAVRDVSLTSVQVRFLNLSVLILFIASLLVVLTRMIIALIQLVRGGEEYASPSIVNNFIRIVIYTVGFLIILELVGIPVGPALAALGVGALGVSLALQNTLSNLFSGIQITAARLIHRGDYVRLSTGEEGYVTDINWNNTQIKQLANNTVIVPNSVLTAAILTNFYDPVQEMSISFDIGVGYDSDLEHVERVTVEVAQEVMREVAGGVPEFETLIRYNQFRDFSINFTAILRVREFVDQFLIKHEFIKRLHKRYQQENIHIPFPIRTVHMEQTNAEEQLTASAKSNQSPQE